MGSGLSNAMRGRLFAPNLAPPGSLSIAKADGELKKRKFFDSKALRGRSKAECLRSWLNMAERFFARFTTEASSPWMTQQPAMESPAEIEGSLAGSDSGNPHGKFGRYPEYANS